MAEHLSQLVLMIVPLIFAVTIHEVAHGYVAYRLGDPTAMMAGRLTLNPMKHLDPVGSLILPLLLKLSGSPFIFGYAKPVPVNFNNIRNYRTGTIYVASAGVVTNLIFAILSAIAFQTLLRFGNIWPGSLVESVLVPIATMLNYSVLINLILAIFNLIPVPPLDGSRIVAMLLPPDLSMKFAQIERYGMLIIIILLMTRVLGKIISFFVMPLYQLLIGF